PLLPRDQAADARSRGNVFSGRGARRRSRDDQARLHRYGGGLRRRHPDTAALTPMRRGVMGRQCIIEYFSRQAPRRRERGGDDIFAQLCRATYDDGTLMTVADIADHMSFLMMAAHDTLTSSLSAFVYFLTAHPEWQEKLRAEVLGLGLQPS